MLNIIFEGIATTISVVGTLIIVYGVIKAVVIFLNKGLSFQDESKKHVLDHVSLGLGRHLILGLEFSIAGDIIMITVNPGWDELGKLGLIVILRTILSVFLTRELKLISEGKIEHRA